MAAVHAELAVRDVPPDMADAMAVDEMEVEATVEAFREFARLRSSTFEARMTAKVIIDVSTLRRCSYAMRCHMRILKYMCETFAPWVWDCGPALATTLCRMIRQTTFADTFGVFSVRLCEIDDHESQETF
jgi:hypothetical protein